MKKDDTGPYTEAAFAVLVVANLGVLVFSVKRLYDHLRGTKRYAPLIIFYGALSGFLLSECYPARVLFFMDVAFDYPIWLYSLLNILPVVLVFSSSTIVSYIWSLLRRREIAIEFSPDHILSPEAKREANYRNLCLISIINALYFALFVLSFSLLYSSASSAVLLLYRPHSVIRIEDMVLCVVSSLLLYYSGHRVTIVIRGLMRKDPPVRFFVVKISSISAFSLRAAANLILLCLEVSGIDQTQSDWGYGVFLFCFFFVLDDCLLIVLLVLVYTQVKTKKKLKPRGYSFNAIEIDNKEKVKKSLIDSDVFSPVLQAVSEGSFQSEDVRE